MTTETTNSHGATLDMAPANVPGLEMVSFIVELPESALVTTISREMGGQYYLTSLVVRDGSVIGTYPSMKVSTPYALACITGKEA